MMVAHIPAWLLGVFIKPGQTFREISLQKPIAAAIMIYFAVYLSFQVVNAGNISGINLLTNTAWFFYFLCFLCFLCF